MNYSFSDIAIPITRDFLLSHNSEETYMTTYLGIPVERGLHISPLRSDKKPTASFYRNKKGTLIFHDFGTGFNGDFVSVVMELNHCSYKEALRIIASDFGLIKSVNVPKTIKKIVKSSVTFKESKDTIIQIEHQDFTDSDLEWWKSFGITQKTLLYYNVHSCKNIFLNGAWFTSYKQNNPIYGYFGGIRNNIELWRIYFPKKTSYRFLSNWDSNMIQGATQLPLNGNLLIITKSLKDTMCLYELGLAAIAPCSETLFVSDQTLFKLKNRFKNIVVFYDNDQAGINGMKKIRNKYPDLKFFFIPRRYKAKDVSDFVKKYGFDYTKELISKCLNNYGLDCQKKKICWC